MVTLNLRRHEYKENPSLWLQSIHKQVKLPESGSGGKATLLGQRENYCLPNSLYPQGQWFSTLVRASESLGEFEKTQMFRAILDLLNTAGEVPGNME